MTARRTPTPRVDVTDELFDAVVEGVAILRAERDPARRHVVPLDADPRAIRTAMGLSQTAFAARFGIGLAALRDWEQGRRRPDPAARTLLKVIAHAPEAVIGALGESGERRDVGTSP